MRLRLLSRLGRRSGLGNRGWGLEGENVVLDQAVVVIPACGKGQDGERGGGDGKA